MLDIPYEVVKMPELIKSYNTTLRKVKTFLEDNPGESIYRIAKKIRSDPRTVKSMLNIMEDFGYVDSTKVPLGRKTFTSYSIKKQEEAKKMETKLTSNTLLANWLDLIAEENGYRFGQLWRHTNKSLGGVMPIIQDDVEGDNRGYILLEETNQDNLTLIDTGEINKIKVKSNEEQPVFIRMGTIFKGDSQERAADISVVVMPGKEQEIPVKCVHASKGINAGASFKAGGYVPHSIEKGFARGSGQSETWSRVERHNTMMFAMAQSSGVQLMSLGASDDLVGASEKIKKYKKGAKNILKNIPSVEGQVGCVIFDKDGILSLEVFNHPLSWKAFHQAIYEKYEDILTEEQEKSLFQLKEDLLPKLIKAFIGDMKSATLRQAKSQGAYRTFLLNKTAIGEITELEGKLIHALGIRKSYDDEETRDDSSRISLGSLGDTPPWNGFGGVRPGLRPRRYTSSRQKIYTSPPMRY